MDCKGTHFCRNRARPPQITNVKITKNLLFVNQTTCFHGILVTLFKEYLSICNNPSEKAQKKPLFPISQEEGRKT